MTRKWKIRERSFEEGRFKRYGNDEEQREVGRERQVEGPRQAVPDGIRTDERVWEKSPQPVRIDQGITGVVERKSSLTYGSVPNKLAVVGYLLKLERDSDSVRAYFSREHQLLLFDIQTGRTTGEPNDVMAEGARVTFANFPEPVYHRAFTSRDGSDRAFGPHVKKLTDGRVKDMEIWREPGQNIERYKQSAGSFLIKAGDIFKEVNQY